MVLKENQKPITKKKIFIRLVMLGLLLPVLFTLFNQAKNFLNKNITESFKIETVTFDIEHIYSDDLAKKITCFITEKTSQESLLGFDQKEFRKELKNAFNIIKSIDWQYRVPNTLHLKIIGTLPKCLVNKTHVLGTKRELFKREYFNDNKNLELLENITINEKLLTNNKKKNKISKLLFEFISKIPKEQWEKFYITYHKYNQIELAPKKSFFACKIISDEKSFFDEKKFESIHKIVADLFKKNMITQKILQSQKPLVAFDMRFDGRIIVKVFDTLRRGTGK